MRRMAALLLSVSLPLAAVAPAWAADATPATAGAAAAAPSAAAIAQGLAAHRAA